MGSAAVPGPIAREDVLRILAVDRGTPASIGYSLTSARENARRAREIVSSELWECLNTTAARVPRRVAGDKVHDFFTWVRERTALAVGIMDSGASRDEAFHFFTLGRSLERADMTARLLATRSLTEASGPSWTTILRSCGAYEAYLRTYRGVPSTRNAAEFLLHDRLFPRSILYAVTRAVDSLRDIEPRHERAGVSDRAVRLLGQVQSELEFRPVADVLDDLPAYMSTIQDATSAATSAITQRYFPENSAPSWTGERS